MSLTLQHVAAVLHNEQRHIRSCEAVRELSQASTVSDKKPTKAARSLAAARLAIPELRA